MFRHCSVAHFHIIGICINRMSYWYRCELDVALKNFLAKLMVVGPRESVRLVADALEKMQ